MAEELYSGERKKEPEEQNLFLSGRQMLKVTGVLDVDSYDEHSINAQTVCGLLTVEGKGLHVRRLSLEEGILEIGGTVDALFYSEMQEKPAGTFFSRLFR